MRLHSQESDKRKNRWWPPGVSWSYFSAWAMLNFLYFILKEQIQNAAEGNLHKCNVNKNRNHEPKKSKKNPEDTNPVPGNTSLLWKTPRVRERATHIRWTFVVKPSSSAVRTLLNTTTSACCPPQGSVPFMFPLDRHGPYLWVILLWKYGFPWATHGHPKYT